MFSRPSKFSFLINSVLLIAACLSWTSCQKGELDEIREAQRCLNRSAPSEAAACTNGLRSKSSSEASKLVCASIYIADGFGTIAGLAEAIEQMTNTSGSCGGSCSPTLSAVTTLKFSGATGAAKEAKVSDAISYCGNSGVAAYTTVTTMFTIGTLMSIANDSLSGASSAVDLENAIASGAVSPVLLGTAVIASYSSACSDPENISESNVEFCQEMGVAISQTDGSATAVGNCLKHKLQNPSATTCP